MLKLVSNILKSFNKFILVFFGYSKFSFIFEGTIYEGTSNIQLNTIAKLIDQEF